MTDISFAGQVAIVTGAGGGIGRAHALEIARRGGSVVVNDLGGDVAGRGGSASLADAVVGEIREAGGTAIASHDSAATTEGVEAMVAAAIAAFGRIDAVIANAGNMRNAHIADMRDEDWDAVIATQLGGPFRLTRAVWPHMRAQGYGRIVYTSSSAGLLGTTMVANYASAKAGILGLTNVAALEGEPLGILCNAIMPNAMTRMAAQAAADWSDGAEGDALAMPPDIGNSMNPEFNMPLAVYLASAACTSTKGIYSQCLGRSARAFVGITAGWQAQRQSAPAVEEIAAHWPEIGDAGAGYSEPPSPGDELIGVLSQGPVAV
jgi:NAD(P)-dependent dehydrogenase (short-subunit alcohol dehydrogenase family)